MSEMAARAGGAGKGHRIASMVSDIDGRVLYAGNPAAENTPGTMPLPKRAGGRALVQLPDAEG